ncbi:hypothetical protein [Micromonospora tarensis]|uniref:Uncharacterized protein n=1 Tax=Micromonospora tarensis TaxID=2806100 RepID=A0ABS1YEF3_9ACTN|nr:hypothetical protein [Micromonospora tarensis]MBM0275786.1 hypothetical protein [Micromonospora tarensis]
MELSLLSFAISFAALLVAAYGILERHQVARRADRLRLTVITGELAELLEGLVKAEITTGDLVENVHTRMEVLAQQALSLIRAHEVSLTSAELRVIAVALEETGYNEASEGIWGVAGETARSEGRRQMVYANRGHAYFLFRRHREVEARTLLEATLSQVAASSDDERLVRLETFAHWRVWEAEVAGPQSREVADLGERIDRILQEFSTSRGRAMALAFLGIDPTPEESGQGR